MAASTDVVKHLYDGTVTLADGTGTPVTLDVQWSQGDTGISGLAAVQRDVIAYQTRGALHSVRYGARNFPTVSFSFMFGSFTDATDSAPLDFLMFTNKYSANISTINSPGEVHGLKITLTVEGTDLGDASDHTIVLDDVHCTFDISEGEPNTCTVNGTVYGSVTRTGPS